MMHLTLIDKKHETPDAVSFIFEPEQPLVWQAGQFLHYKLPHPQADDRGEERYFTISAAPHEGNVMLTTRFSVDHPSSFKSALEEMPFNAVIEADAPEGDFIVTDPTESMVFIAGGAGITPFRSILTDLDHRNLPMHVTLLYANRDEHFIFRDELEALAAKHDTFRIKYFISPQRIDAEAIKQSVPDITKPLFYVSGPEPMAEAMEKMLLAMEIPAHHIKTDFFPGYAWS